jgi:hypothetical protein
VSPTKKEETKQEYKKKKTKIIRKVIKIVHLHNQKSLADKSIN